MSNIIERLITPIIITSILSLGFICTVYSRLIGVFLSIDTKGNYSFAPAWQSAVMLVVFCAFIACMVCMVSLLNKKQLLKPIGIAFILSLVISFFGRFLADVTWLYWVARESGKVFSVIFDAYFAQEWWIYLLQISVIAASGILLKQRKIAVFNASGDSKIIQSILLIIAPILTALLLPYVYNLFSIFTYQESIFLPPKTAVIFVIGYVLGLAMLWFVALGLSKKQKLRDKFLMQLAISSATSASFLCFVLIFSLFVAVKSIAAHSSVALGFAGIKLIGVGMLDNLVVFIPLACIIIARAVLKLYFQKQQVNGSNPNTSGKFGSAKWASKYDLKEIKAFDEDNGALVGADFDGRLLYLPFTNKLTLAPPGSGKTVSSSIPILLTHKGPAFVFDIKGELWATTARYRSEVLKRKVIVIDPYSVTKEQDFIYGKSSNLLIENRINPFDFIPTEETIRDRMINAFASSFVISDDVKNSGGARHFDENAKILIRGYIDYMMKAVAPDSRNLSMLYHLLSENADSAETTFKDMFGLGGRSAAASNQISRVGINERGSILSTSYRQIDWMSDSNMQHAMSTSTFDLRDFIKGDMDIYIVIPEDQVKEHGRLIRMLMSLLMGIIVQANPSELPKDKMLFLLDEIAQLGYCPDVEQCIEVLRARGVVVWTVFQSLSQVEIFQKPDLFKGVALKQIFTLDDVKTMEWIKALGGKTTVQNETVSHNRGDSRHKMQVFGGNVSHGAGTSVQETSADLIQIDEIREMPKDEQFIFMHGQKPIRCKKIKYFEHPFFAGKFDANPVERKSQTGGENKS